MRRFKGVNKSRAKALLVTAHPDDETIFAGGTIAEFKTWRWTVLCLTDCDNRHNKRRRKELLRACRVYDKSGSRVVPFMLGMARKNKRFSKKNMKENIRNFIRESGPFDIVFTHNSEGDYGHKTHKLIHDAVKEMKLRNVYNFSLQPLGSARTIRLSRRSRLAKKQAMDIYLRGSQKTNLARLKKILAPAARAGHEHFIPSD